MNELDFSDLQTIELPVKVGNKDYLLREASGDAVARHRNAQLACSTFDAKGNVSLKGLGDLEILLVSLCLFTPDNKPVPKQTIASWPNKVIKQLYLKAKEISALEETPKERSLLAQALDSLGSPVSWEDLRTFVNSLPEENYKALQLWCKPTEEESAKNSQSATKDGSS